MKLFKKGFTLVELLVTIGVLAVVAAGVVALIDPRQKLLQGADSKVLNDISQVATAAQAYAAQTGDFPADATQLGTELTTTPIAPSGYTGYTITPNATTFFAMGQLKSTRFMEQNCGTGVTFCYYKFYAGRTCFQTTSGASCP